MSSTGVRIGSPSTSVSGASAGSPPRTSATSVLVPPMSKVMRSPRPERAACRTAPTTPAAGPLNSAVMAVLRIAAAGSRPPLDCMTLNRPRNPASARVASNRSR